MGEKFEHYEQLRDAYASDMSQWPAWRKYGFAASTAAFCAIAAWAIFKMLWAILKAVAGW